MTRKKQTPAESTAAAKTTKVSRVKKATTPEIPQFDKNVTINEIVPNKFRLKFKNAKQKDFLKLIDDKDIVFAHGVAGTGKSFLSIAKGIELLQTYPDKYTSLKIIKPIVEVEESYGYLPGGLHEKLEPILASSIDIVDTLVGATHRTSLELAKILIVEPLGFLRGKTLNNTIVVIEEAQNMSPRQMKMVLTRLGENSKFIISGDIDQSDKYDDVRKSGLYDAIRRFKNVSEMGMIEFLKTDIVRHPLIIKIIEEYNKDLDNPRVIPNVPAQDRQPKITKKVEKLNWFQRNFKW